MLKTMIEAYLIGVVAFALELFIISYSVRNALKGLLIRSNNGLSGTIISLALAKVLGVVAYFLAIFVLNLNGLCLALGSFTSLCLFVLRHFFLSAEATN